MDEVFVDLNRKANRKAHHTDEYDVADLILRRGQDFVITIRLDQPFDAKRDILTLQFVTGACSDGKSVHHRCVGPLFNTIQFIT